MARIPRLLLWTLMFGVAALVGAALLVDRSVPVGLAPATDSTPAGAPIVVLAAGDSITAESYPDHLQALFRAAGLNVRVINSGIRGHTSGEYLAYLRSSGILGKTNPDFVLLQLGTNDVRVDRDRTEVSRFYRQMNEILDELLGHRLPRGTHPTVVLSTIPPVVVSVPNHFDDSSKRRVSGEINPTIGRLARERALPLVDTHDLFLRHPEWLPEIHPNQDGYRAMARQWFDFLAPRVMGMVE